MNAAVKRLWWYAGLVLLAGAGAWPWLPQQDADAYFKFADQRAWLGIPNFGDVASNFAFAFVGIHGLLRVRKWRKADPHSAILPYAALLSVAMILVALGSGYFHWFRTRESLVWDRMAMTLIFASLLTMLIRDRHPFNGPKYLYAVLAMIGIITAWGVHYGFKDVRPYAILQAGAIVMIVTLALDYQGRQLPRSSLIWLLVLYGVAKILESNDTAIFQALHQVSGHTLKHVVAALAILMFVHGWPARSAIPLSRDSIPVPMEKKPIP